MPRAAKVWPCCSIRVATSPLRVITLIATGRRERIKRPSAPCDFDGHTNARHERHRCRKTAPCPFSAACKSDHANRVRGRGKSSMRCGSVRAGTCSKKTIPRKSSRPLTTSWSAVPPMTPVIANKVLQFFRAEQNVHPEADYGLSEREKTVLKFLVDGKSYKMIAESMNISYHTVNSHVRKVYDKLQVHLPARP